MKEVRQDCRDIYNAYMVDGADFEGKYDIPICPSTITEFPRKVITFNEAKQELNKDNPDFDSVVSFYKDDYKFDGPYCGVWSNPDKWIPILMPFQGVIQPDFSTYQDFPKALKIYNVYRMRAIGYYFWKNGIKIITNYRFGTDETFDFCCDGIQTRSLVFVSTLGCIKSYEDINRIVNGIRLLISQKDPRGIGIYGSVPQKLKFLLKKNCVPFRKYETEIVRRMKGAC